MRILLRVLGPALLFFWTIAFAATSFGSWASGSADDGSNLYAASINDSGSVLGQYCYISSGNCVWLLAISASCEDGSEYPVMANSDTGAVQLKVSCKGKVGDLYSYVFSEFEGIDTIVKTGKRIGFALPLQQDQFRVVRFKLDGSVDAIKIMRNSAQKVFDKSKTGTKDTDL